jgi:dTDP-4-dehydrorhamnose 3,5-epimerase-like enzyme
MLEVVLSGDKPQVLRIPGHYWHGFKAIGQQPVYLTYFVNKLYDYQKPRRRKTPIERPINSPTDNKRLKRRPTNRQAIGLALSATQIEKYKNFFQIIETYVALPLCA